MANHKYLVNINDSLWNYLKGRADFLGIPVSQLVRNILMSDWEKAMYGNGLFSDLENQQTAQLKTEAFAASLDSEEEMDEWDSWYEDLDGNKKPAPSLKERARASELAVETLRKMGYKV